MIDLINRLLYILISQFSVFGTVAQKKDLDQSAYLPYDPIAKEPPMVVPINE